MFIHKLCTIESNELVKHIFLHELYSQLIISYDNSITSDIVSVLYEYGLSDYLYKNAMGNPFPNKYAWKAIVKERIHGKTIL